MKLGAQPLVRRLKRTFGLWRGRAHWTSWLHDVLNWIRGAAALIIGIWSGLLDFGQKPSTPDPSPSPGLMLSSDSINLVVAVLFLSVLFDIVLWAVKFVDLYQATQLPKVPASTFAQPTAEARALMSKRSDIDAFAIGACIDIERFPGSHRDLPLNGWALKQVHIDERAGRSRHRESGILQNAISNTDNRTKYWLQHVSAAMADQSDGISVKVTRTDFNETQTAFRNLAGNPDLRRQISELSPSRHHAPNSLCLHLLVEFSDRTLLCHLRRKDAAYHPNALSISCEEQLSDVDFDHAEGTMTGWFQRAICEEVFPLIGTYKKHRSEAWQEAAKHVDIESMRVWSVIFEEPSASFALFGVVSLSIPSTAYAEVCREILLRTGDGRDNEGRYHLLPKDQRLRLVTTGQCEVLLEDGSGKVPVSAAKMHPTAAYRLLRYMAVRRELG